MITRRKAALLQALSQAGTTNVEDSVLVKTKIEKSEGAEIRGGRGLVKKLQVISLNSDSEEDGKDGPQEDSESDCSDEMGASAMSQSSDVSAMDQTSDEECTTEKDDGSEVVQLNTESTLVSIDSLAAEKVLQIIRDGGDMKKLTLDYCRSYLRYHGLRISGNKPVLIDRIKQHIELKTGVPEKYRAATFTINCTGDVCKGDVIKFKQKVYKKFSVATRGSEAVGERIVAGRVVTESYGEKKQQHTFTVEVLWSTGYKPLPPMRQLLVKGRNLYRLRTYRQKWEDERLRNISLDEKHERGAAARSKRRETLRASGPRKIIAGGRKPLPNPYMAMGRDENIPSDLLGGSVGPLHRSWFPRYSSANGQPNVLPQKPVMAQRSGFYGVQQNTSHHSNQPAAVAHDTSVQPPIPENRSASDAVPAPDRAGDEKKEGNDSSVSSCPGHSIRLPSTTLASTTSKEIAILHNISTDRVTTDTRSQARRHKSTIVPWKDPDSDRRPQELKTLQHSNLDARREQVKCVKNSYDGKTPSRWDQPPREDRRSSEANPCHSNRQIGNKSPCLSDVRNEANNRNVSASEAEHYVRASPLHLQSRIISGPGPFVDRRLTENISPRWSDMIRWRVDSNNGIIPATGMPQDARASPLRLPDRTGHDRRHNENISPWSNDQNSWKKDASFKKDPVPGVLHDMRPLSTGIESRNFFQDDPHSVMRHNESQSPWRLGSSGWRRDGYHHTDHLAAAPHFMQAQVVRIQPNFAGDHSFERRRNENRSPRGSDSNFRRIDVGQQHHISRGGQLPPVSSSAINEQFPCPRSECTNIGSKLCSYRICVKCCKQQGGFCSNPKHSRASGFSRR